MFVSTSSCNQKEREPAKASCIALHCLLLCQTLDGQCVRIANRALGVLFSQQLRLS